MERKVITLRGRAFVADVALRRGTLVGLWHPRDRIGTNFVLDPDAEGTDDPDRALDFGAIFLRYKTVASPFWEKASTAFSDDIRRIHALRRKGRACRVRVTYDEVSQDPSGLRGLQVLESFRLNERRRALEWRFRILNATKYSIELGEVSVPVPFHNTMTAPTLTELYRGRVAVRPYASGHSSFVLVQPLEGRPPFLLMLPHDDTPLEAVGHIRSEAYRRLWFPGAGPVVLYIHSRATRETEDWHEWFNGHTSYFLKPGEPVTYGFDFFWIDDYEAIEKRLVAGDKVAVRVAPAPVVPTGVEARFDLKCERRIDHVESDTGELRRLRGHTYAVTFHTLGPHTIKVEYAASKWTRLHFYCIDSVERLIRARADFTVKNQQVLDPKDPYFGAFLMWDAEENILVRRARAPYFTGASDELGFADPLFLAGKNIFWPDDEEIAALETYVDRFLLGRIQDQRTYAVRLWYGDAVWRHYRGSDTVRSFNYPHVFNIYWSLYEIGRRHGMTKRHSPKEYLRMAYRTALAFYELEMIAGDAYVIGNIGTSFLLRIVEALGREEMAEQRKALLARATQSARYFVSHPYAYGSEYAYDTTGYETLYFFQKYLGSNRRAARRTLRTLLASRGCQPTWYQFGQDCRWGFGNGKYGPSVLDEIALSYMTPLNGLAMLDAYGDEKRRWLLENAYASATSMWALVGKRGETRHLFSYEPSTMRFDPWSSESGVGLFAALFLQRAIVVHDPDLGTVGYGCEVRRERGRYSVTLRDGVRQTFVFVPTGVEVQTTCGHIESLRFDESLRAIDITIENPRRCRVVEPLVITNLPHARYEASVGDTPLGTSDVSKGVLNVDIPLRPRKATRVLLNAIG